MACQSKRERKCVAAALALGVIFYLAFSVADALVKTPYADEGYFADASLNLVTKGRMGTTIIESAGTPLLRFGEHTYWVMPLYLVAQAGWFKLVGFGLFQSRLLSVISGLGVLLAMFEIVWKLTGELIPASLTVFLLGIDFTFVDIGSLARMDMMTAAFGFGGLACYLILRERNFPWAIFVSQALIVCTGMTHPNGVLYLVASMFLILYLDAKRVHFRQILLALVPYIIAAGAWSAYIFQDFPAFRSQFAFNAGQQNRFQGFIHPLAALITKVTVSYATTFGLAAETLHIKAVVLALYISGVVCLLAFKPLRRQRGTHILLALWSIFFLIQAVFNNRLWFYMIHIVPLYAAILAVALWGLWRWRLAPGGDLAGALVILSLCVIEVGGGAYQFKTKMKKRREYEEFISFVKKREAPATLVVGDSGLGFDLGFDGPLVDKGYALLTASLGHAKFRLGCVGDRQRTSSCWTTYIEVTSCLLATTGPPFSPRFDGSCRPISVWFTRASSTRSTPLGRAREKPSVGKVVDGVRLPCIVAVWVGASAWLIRCPSRKIAWFRHT